MSKRNLWQIVLVTCTVSLFTACRPPSSNPEYDFHDHFTSSKMVYSTPNNELVALQREVNDDLIIYPNEQIARWTYSKNENTLYRNLSIESQLVRYYDDQGQGIIGMNYDECGGGALIGQIDAFLYVADSGTLDWHEPTGTLLLVVNSPKLGRNEILYEFTTKRSELSQPECCYVGTNAEYEGMIFFSEFENNAHALRVLELSTRNVYTLFTDDIIMAPSVSPNGDMVVYTKYDGIYGYSIITNEITLLVEISWADKRYYDFEFRYYSFFNFVPIASWLPSGDEISYHVENIYYDMESGDRIVSYDIYTYNLSTNRSTVLVENALNPYWILP